jgi:hypothetical protein
MMGRMREASFKSACALAAFAGLLVAAAPPVGATPLTTVVGNLAEANGGYGSTSFNTANTRFAQGFSTAASPQFADNDGNGFVAFQVLWHLQPGGGMGLNDQGEFDFVPVETGFSVSLHADNNGAPGVVISGPDLTTTNQTRLLTFSLGAAVAPLQPNTSYWLTIGFYAPYGSGLSSPPFLSTTSNTAGTGSGSFGSLLVSTDNGATWGGASQRGILEVNVEAVPEPSALALAALGIAAACLARRRK